MVYMREGLIQKDPWKNTNDDKIMHRKQVW